MFKVEINYKNTLHCIYAKYDQYLLNALEENKIFIPYNCREGYCASCALTLHQGEVVWVKDNLLPLHNNQILTCCCKAASDIKISDINNLDDESIQ